MYNVCTHGAHTQQPLEKITSRHQEQQQHTLKLHTHTHGVASCVVSSSSTVSPVLRATLARVSLTGAGPRFYQHMGPATNTNNSNYPGNQHQLSTSRKLDPAQSLRDRFDLCQCEMTNMTPASTTKLEFRAYEPFEGNSRLELQNHQH